MYNILTYHRYYNIICDVVCNINLNSGLLCLTSPSANNICFTLLLCVNINIIYIGINNSDMMICAVHIRFAIKGTRAFDLYNIILAFSFMQ